MTDSLKLEDLAELLESLDDVGMPLPTEIRLSALDAITSLSRELEEAKQAVDLMNRTCDSYAVENQQFHDRFTAAEASLAQARAEISLLRETVEVIADGDGDPQEIAQQTIEMIRTGDFPPVAPPPARGIVTEGRDCVAGSGSASARVEPGPEDAP